MRCSSFLRKCGLFCRLFLLFCLAEHFVSSLEGRNHEANTEISTAAFKLSESVETVSHAFVHRSAFPIELTQKHRAGFPMYGEVPDAAEIESAFRLRELLEEYGKPATTHQETHIRRTRDLKLLSVITDNVDLAIGRIWENRPKFSLETPDLAIGLEGLFSTLARTTLSALASQVTGGSLTRPDSPSVPLAPQAKGVQQQYQLQYSRGPWNVQSGLQIGIQREDGSSGNSLFGPSADVSSFGDPQAAFQQASDIYYGQAFNDGYDQGFTQGTQSSTIGTPSGNLPPLTAESPAGFNEGVVAGFTRGLQDGYYAGFQSARQSQPNGSPGQTGIYSVGTATSTTSLPHALPHVSSNGPLPQQLFQAQQQAMLAYTQTLEERIAELERGPEISESPSSNEEQANSDASGDETKRQRRSGQDLDKQDTFASETDDPFSQEDRVPDEEEAPADDVERAATTETTIAGMSLLVATLLLSGIVFVIVFLCCLCWSAWMSRSRSEKSSSNSGQATLKSKTSDMGQISAYMHSPSIFDQYISPRPQNPAIHRSAGARQ